jgi:TIR domain
MKWASATAALRRFVPYAAVWLCLVLIVALTPLGNLWHEADSWVLQVPLALGNGLTLDRGLSVVDLDVGSDLGAADLRAHEVVLLDAINAAAGVGAKPHPGAAKGSCAANAVHVGAIPPPDPAGLRPKPDSIVFDIAFLKANSAASPQCVAPLIAELHAAELTGVKIYGALDLENPNSGGSISGNIELDPNYEDNHDERIYAEFAGKGHTEFSADPTRRATPLIYYPKVVIMPAAGSGTAGSVAPCALPIVAVGQADDQCLPLISLNQQAEVVNVVVPLGAGTSFERTRTLYEQAVRKPAALAGQLVLIGDERIDYAAGDPRSKFEMLAWAMSQSLASLHGRPYPRVLIDENIMLALAIGGAILAFAAFAFVFTLLRGKRFRLVAATIFSLAVPSAAIAAVVAFLGSQNELYSQVGLPSLAVLITAGVSLWAGIASIRGDLFVTSLQDHTKAVAERYDVFISYARTPENAAWVEEHVLGPLARARMPDGKPLRIFFDRQSIKVGFSWYKTIVESIYGSRFFLPVYSEGYFDRPFCREEMDIAMLRQVEMGTFVLPDRYVRTQFVDIEREPAFIDEIIRIITGAQSPEASLEKDPHAVSHRDDDRKPDGADRSAIAPKAR